MDKNKMEKEMVKKSLKTQGEDERFNKALARVMSERMHGKKGYKEYMELIEEIRGISRDEEISIEKAAEKYLDG